MTNCYQKQYKKQNPGSNRTPAYFNKNSKIAIAYKRVYTVVPPCYETTVQYMRSSDALTSYSGGKAGRHGVRKRRIFVEPPQTRQGHSPERHAPRWPVFIARVECLGVFWGVSTEAFPFMFWTVFAWVFDSF